MTQFEDIRSEYLYSREVKFFGLEMNPSDTIRLNSSVVEKHSILDDLNENSSCKNTIKMTEGRDFSFLGS